MTMRQYWHAHMFRAGLWSYMISFRQIGSIMAKQEQLPVSWRFIELRRPATVTPSSENSPFWRMFIINGCRWQKNRFEVVLINSLGAAGQNTTPVNGDFGNGQAKMADFLLDLRYASKRLFCSSWPDTYVYRVSFLYVKVHGGAEVLKTARGRYGAIWPRPYLKPRKYVNFHHAWHVCQIWWVLGYVAALKNAIEWEKA